MNLVTDSDFDALTQADAYIAVDYDNSMPCYYYATDLRLYYPGDSDDTARIERFPTTLIRITEYF